MFIYISKESMVTRRKLLPTQLSCILYYYYYIADYRLPYHLYCMLQWFMLCFPLNPLYCMLFRISTKDINLNYLSVFNIPWAIRQRGHKALTGNMSPWHLWRPYNNYIILKCPDLHIIYHSDLHFWSDDTCI